MARQTWKPGTMVYPVPAAMVTVADKAGNTNIITIAWTGTVCSDPPMTYVSIKPERYSHHMVEETGEFVINLTTKDTAFATDYCGVKSGRDVDKWKEMGLTLLFISHDMGVVRYLSDRIGVMYLGSLVEEAPTEELFANPLHSYTKALFASIPDISKKGKSREMLKGELPVRTDEFHGCVFHTRCPYADECCCREEPVLREVSPGHRVACHKAMEQ